MIDLNKIEGIFLFSGSTDMRLGINSLVQKVMAISDENDLKNKLFIFCGKDKRNIKVIEWNYDGYWLYQKKLTNGKFQVPKEKDGTILIEKRQFYWLLEGLSIKQKICT